jgi:hypothetical protein
MEEEELIAIHREHLSKIIHRSLQKIYPLVYEGLKRLITTEYYGLCITYSSMTKEDLNTICMIIDEATMRVREGKEILDLCWKFLSLYKYAKIMDVYFRSEYEALLDWMNPIIQIMMFGEMLYFKNGRHADGTHKSMDNFLDQGGVQCNYFILVPPPANCNSIVHLYQPKQINHMRTTFAEHDRDSFLQMLRVTEEFKKFVQTCIYDGENIFHDTMCEIAFTNFYQECKTANNIPYESIEEIRKRALHIRDSDFMKMSPFGFHVSGNQYECDFEFEQWEWVDSQIAEKNVDIMMKILTMYSFIVYNEIG